MKLSRLKTPDQFSVTISDDLAIVPSDAKTGQWAKTGLLLTWRPSDRISKRVYSIDPQLCFQDEQCSTARCRRFMSEPLVDRIPFAKILIGLAI